jgi:hypothetical protein
MLCDNTVLTVAMMKIQVFWDVMLHQPLNIYQATWQNFSEDLNLVYTPLWQIFFNSPPYETAMYLFTRNY